MKLLMIIATLLGLGAVAINFAVTQSKYDDVQAELASANRSKLAMIEERREWESNAYDAEQARISAQQSEDLAKADLSIVEERIRQLIAEQGRVEGRLAQLQQENSEAEARLPEIKRRIADALEISPSQVRPEDVQSRFQEIQARVNSLQDEFDDLDENRRVAESRRDDRLARVVELQNLQAERVQRLSLNSWSGRVVDIDNDWGLAVINAGTSAGFDPSVEFLVVSGGSQVAELEVVNMEPNQSLVSVKLVGDQGININDEVRLLNPITGG